MWALSVTNITTYGHRRKGKPVGTLIGARDLLHCYNTLLREGSPFRLDDLVHAPRQRPHVLHAAPAEHFSGLTVCLAHTRVPALETLRPLLTLPDCVPVLLYADVPRASW